MTCLKIIACYKLKQIITIYELKKSFQFEFQKLHVINIIKCLIFKIVENYEKLKLSLFDEGAKISYTVIVWYEYCSTSFLCFNYFF